MNVIPWKSDTNRAANPTLPESATDALVIDTWLRGRPLTTQEAYRADIMSLFDFTSNKPLQRLTLVDLLDFQESMAGQAPTSIARRLSAVKSLLTFTQKAGYTLVNIGAALR